MARGIVRLRQSAHRVSLGEDAKQAIALHDEDRTDPVLSHDGDRFTHGFRRFDAVKGRLHDVTHARHNQILCR